MADAPDKPALDDAEAERVARLLEAVADDRTLLAGLSPERRRALLVAAGRASRPDRDDVRRLSRELRRRERRDVKSADRALVESTGLRVQRRAPVFTPLWLVPPDAPAQQPDDAPALREERACYVCKAPYRQVHFFYDSMCAACGDFNWAKRSQTADLRGRTALVTGARVKIGFQVALMLLRAGARVVATTRFPNDAAARYEREADFGQWAARLRIHGLDLRHSPSVELFARYLCETEARLDVLVNNACQTVRRPPAYYAHLLEGEASLAQTGDGRDTRRLLAGHEDLSARLHGTSDAGSTALLAPGAAGGAGIWASARLSQLRYLDEDYRALADRFPAGRYDEDLQQVDLREVNSWRLALADVPTPELLEVHLVNAVAPFILCARLKPLLLRAPGRDKHVVNVSAMEGQFYRAKKTDRHPHTNMAKAALNMMTRTSAPDCVRDGIHMNAVDTGWVTDEDPATLAARKAEAGFQPPLDVVDGAARVLDPVFSGLNTGEHLWGQFLKDYRPAPW